MVLRVQLGAGAFGPLLVELLAADALLRQAGHRAIQVARSNVLQMLLGWSTLWRPDLSTAVKASRWTGHNLNEVVGSLALVQLSGHILNILEAIGQCKAQHNSIVDAELSDLLSDEGANTLRSLLVARGKVHSTCDTSTL